MNGNQLSIDIDEVLVLGVGVLLDFLINLAKVLSGDGGVVTASCLYFLVTASIRTVGEGCAVFAFGKTFWFVE